MKAGTLPWWAGKVRQLIAHARARVSVAERSALSGWLSAAQAGIFDSMTVADQRHGLDVVAALRRDGIADPDVLVAGLLHDAGKGATGAFPRIAHSLGQVFGPWAVSLVARLPGMADPLTRLAEHPERSAAMAAAAGCSERTVELIRWQEAPRDPEYGERLRLADEAN
ncbi:MAG: hypothetical protein ABI573_11950 [Chloroflexota bacterium]